MSAAKAKSNVVDITTPPRVFACQKCGEPSPAFKTKCGKCRAWNTIAIQGPERRRAERDRPSERSILAENSLQIPEDEVLRIPTGIAELDRALGGGAVAGGVVLVCGEPGSGKSTLFLQSLSALAKLGHKTLYVSGEESVQQVAARARRLGLADQNLFLIATDNLDEIFERIDLLEPEAVVFDSIQTLRAQNLETPAGSVSQLREATSQIIEVCKARDIAAFIVGHVTKDGGIAGPRSLEHLVDAVFNIEGDRAHTLRMLRAVKNRYAATWDVGIFEMTDRGMNEVPNPSAWLLAERRLDAPGSVIVAANEGVRGLLVEVQALVTMKGTGRKTITGIEPKRLGIIMAVLRELVPNTCDIFLNIAGGAKISEPGLDLGCAVAIVSSLLMLPADPHVAVFGEVGLAGEVRGVGRPDARIAEVSAMGFHRVIVPASVILKSTPTLKVQKAKSVRHAVALALGIRESELVKRAMMVRKTAKQRTKV